MPQEGSLTRRLVGSLIVAVVLSVTLAAQETPTERQAASEILKKIDALQKTVDVAGWVTRLTAPNPQRDQVVANARKLMDTELIAMGDDITRNPEIGFKETRSVKILTDYLRAHEFD